MYGVRTRTKDSLDLPQSFLFSFKAFLKGVCLQFNASLNRLQIFFEASLKEGV